MIWFFFFAKKSDKFPTKNCNYVVTRYLTPTHMYKQISITPFLLVFFLLCFLFACVLFTANKKGEAKRIEAKQMRKSYITWIFEFNQILSILFVKQEITTTTTKQTFIDRQAIKTYRNIWNFFTFRCDSICTLPLVYEREEGRWEGNRKGSDWRIIIIIFAISKKNQTTFLTSNFVLLELYVLTSNNAKRT